MRKWDHTNNRTMLRCALVIGLTLMLGCKSKSGSVFAGSPLVGGDPGAPAAPTITSPASSPLITNGANITISGGCEDGSDVHLSGNVVAGEVTSPAGSLVLACSSSSYSFTIAKASDGSYTFNLHAQIGAASSSSVSQVWNRDTVAPAVPTVTTPASDPHYSNSSPLTIAGACETGVTVTLGGDHSDSTTCAASAYSFSVPEGSDGTYNYTLQQDDGANLSPTEAQQWVYDTVAPDISIDSQPTDPNSGNATFTFSSTDGTATFECEMDGGGFSGCTSPRVYSSLSAASHTFKVRSVDLAGNRSSEASYTWTQNAAQTVALYHFDSGSALQDSSSYTNTLTDSGTTLNASGQFADGRDFVAAQNDYMSASDDSSFGTVLNTLTIEAFVRFNSLPSSNGVFQVIATQSNNPAVCANDCGWEMGIIKQGGSPTRRRIYFSASIDNGVTSTQLQSNHTVMNTGVWYHIAVTWNRGDVEFFFNGTSLTTGTIGVSGTESIHDTSANLQLGRNDAGNYVDGQMDEVRLSNVVRSSFPPASAYSSD